jgi:toxin YoeB
MSKRISFETRAWVEYQHWQEHDKKIAKKIYDLLEDTSRHAFTGLGKPEQLKHNLAGSWSRRIDKTNRLVYDVTDDAIIVQSCRNHYDNK